MKREYFIDNLRIWLTALVIVHHTAIAYGASGGWCYVTKDIITGWGQLLLSAFLTINQAFFMSLFFFISAYFLPGSFDKKGFKKYLLDRFIRLGIPLLVYSVIINPLLGYGILSHVNKADSSLTDYFINYNTNYWSTSHLWFVLALLIFESCYALYRKLSGISVSKYLSDKAPGNWGIFLFILITGGLAFLLRTVYPIGGKNIIGLQLGYFVLYISMYLMGILASRKKWIDKLTNKTYRIWMAIAIMMIPVILFVWMNVTEHPENIAKYIGGFTLESLFLAYWEATVCVGLSLLCIVFFKKYLNNASMFSLKMSANSYTAYIIHPLLVVSVTMLFEMIAVKPFPKFLLAGVCGILLTFASAHLIRLLPGVNKVL